MIKNMSTNHGNNITINYVKLMTGENGYELSSVIETLVIEEDIEAGFATGFVAVVDDFIDSSIKFDYTEYVSVSFSTVDGDYKPVPPYEKTFRVTRYETVLQPNTGKIKLMKIHFTDNAAVVNDSMKLMKTFTNTSASAYVKKMCEILEVQDEVFIEDTLHAKHFVVPNISPLDMMNWVKLTSQSKEENGSDFYFFQNRQGVHFKSLSTIKKLEPKHVIVYRPTADTYSYNTILRHEVPKGYDIQSDYRYGGMGATVYTHDLISKEYKKITYDLNKIELINKEPRSPELVLNNDAMVQFWPNNHSYEFMMRNSATHNALLRSASKTRSNFRTTNVSIPGNVDIECGTTVELSMAGIDGGKAIMDCGVMIVKKLRHTVTKTSVTTYLELISDGYAR